MVRTQLQQAFSPALDLTVGLAIVDIMEFTVPQWSLAGDAVNCGVHVQNLGDILVQVYITFYRWNDLPGGAYTFIKNSELFWLLPGGDLWFYDDIGPMPNRDNVYYQAVIQDQDSLNSDPVQLLVQIQPTLTTVIEPTQVVSGGIYKHTGSLTVNGEGVAGQPISLERLEMGEYVEVGFTTTDANGNYDSGDIIAPSPPTTPTTYRVRAYFPGSTILGLAPAFSNTVGLVTGVTNALIPITLSILTGIGLLYVSQR